MAEKAITRRLKIYVNGKEVDATISNLRKNLAKFRAQSNRAVEGSDKWKKYNAQVAKTETELKQAYAAQREFRQETKLTELGIDKSQQALAKFTGSFKTMINGYKTGDYLQVQEGFKGVTKGIKGATKAGLAFIATPIGAFLAVLAGIGVAAKAWFKYNEQVVEALRTTTAITQLTDAAADQARINAETLQEVYGVDFEKSLETAKKLVQQFGISYNEAFATIEDGLARGQGKNEEYFDSLNEYGTFFKQAGYSATEFRDIISTGYDLGIYKDKLPDALKEADLAIKEQTKTTKDALVNAFGVAFTDDLLKKVRTGKITTKEALQEIAKESDNANLNIQQNAQLTADLFKGAGEDAGNATKIFEALNKALNEQKKPLTESQQLVKDQATATRELKQVTSSLFATGDKGFALWIDKAKLFGTKLLVDILKKGIDVYNWVVDLNNESGTFSAILTGIGQSATASFKILSILIKNAFNSIKGLGNVFAGIFTGDLSRIKEGLAQGIGATANVFVDLKKMAVKNFKEIQQAWDGQVKLKHKSINDFTSTDTPTPPPSSTTLGDNSNSELTPEDKKILDSKKKLQEFLKQLEEEQSLQDELKKIEESQRKEEEDILRLESKFAKMAEEAGLTSELEAQLSAEDLALKKDLEATKEIELQKIRDKHAKLREVKDRKLKERLAKEEDTFKKKLIQAEINLNNAKNNAYSTGVSLLKGFFDKSSAIYKALFLFEKGLAINEVIVKSSAAIASAKAADAAVPAVLPPGLPNPAKPFSIAASLKNILATKITAATQIATIAATTLSSFEKGGETFEGTYNGGVDGRGGRLSILHPNEYVIPQPVRQLPGVPRIIEYLEAKRTGQPIESLEDGGSVEPSIDAIIDTTPTQTTALDRLNAILDRGLHINFTLDDVRDFRELEEKLTSTINTSTK